MTGLEIQILGILARIVLQKLAAEAFRRIALAGDLERHRLRLTDAVLSIKKLLEADEKLNSKGYQLKGWLGLLAEVLYDADDVLDEFHYRSLQHQVEGAPHIHLWSRSGMSDKMMAIESRIKEIAAYRSRLGVDMGGDWPRRESHSYVDPSSVIGRDNDKQVVIGHLGLETETLSVIPIVGIEGIGKTTLAQLVYNDAWVKNHFELRMWVYVSSDDFNATRLIKKIINSAEHGNCGDISFDESQIRLKNRLRKERFLLILDDVWNEDREEWLQLESLLNAGKAGSKIIVTTPSRNAAAVMGTVPMHEPSPLSPDDSRSLFTRSAFGNMLMQGRRPNLESIGEEIVERCGGVPGLLSANGCSLYSKTEVGLWISRRDDLLTLRLDGFPSALRQCLALSSIFPTNFRFYSLGLIQLWMALDFINITNPNEDLEDAGHAYMDMLYSRCLLRSREADYGDFFYVQIHNVIHRHVREAVRPMYTVLNFHAPPNQSNIQHVSFSEHEWPQEEGLAWGVLEALGNAKKLRTILCSLVGAREMNESFLKAFIQRFRYMRILDLSYSYFETLPDSISCLKHLRLLSLRGNIRIRKLPNSICTLYSLQTLALLDCTELEQLPRNTRKMISLRHLEMTTRQPTFPELADPNSLQFLGIASCMRLKLLFRGGQRFPALRTLFIHKCGSLVSLLPSIRHLTVLRTLKIADCQVLDLSYGDDDDANFPGFENLWYLVIVNLPRLVNLPRWILRTVPSNSLRRVVIEACQNFGGLPQQYPMSEKFEIRN